MSGSFPASVQVRYGTLNAGDYVYGAVGCAARRDYRGRGHDLLVYRHRPVLFFDENGFTRYTNWK